MGNTQTHTLSHLITSPYRLLALVDRYSKLWDSMGGGGNKEQVMSQLKQLTTTLIGKELVI